MATARQTRSNRLNARQSTGPKTEEGKAASRGNALTHGMAGAGVVLGDAVAEDVARRAEGWAGALRPRDDFERFLVEQAATESVRVEHCQAEERERIGRRALRAELCWDDDRRAEAEATATGLARNPSLVRQRLDATPQGCAWQVERWEALGRFLDTDGVWTGARRSLALDLLGVPVALRDGASPLDPRPGSEADPVATCRAVVAAELTRLADRLGGPMDDLDALDREAAARGLDVGESDRGLRLVRRYEAACQGRMRKALDPLLKPGRAAAEPVPPPAPPEPPRPDPVPAVDPVEDECEDTDAPARPVPEPEGIAAVADPARKGNRRWRKAHSRAARQDRR